MKKTAFLATTLALLFGSIQATNSNPYAPQKNNPLLQNNGEPNPKDLMRDQIDPTDALAIPLDSSEVELEAEIQAMEKEQAEYLKQHPNKK